MTTTFTCPTCLTPVTRRAAVIRSVDLQQVGWHRECAEAEGLAPVGWEGQS